MAPLWVFWISLWEHSQVYEKHCLPVYIAIYSLLERERERDCMNIADIIAEWKERRKVRPI